MKIDGACHCGDLTYEAEIDPDNVVVCHCTDCQVMSATAFRIVARSKPNELTLLSGEPSTYSKIGTSGAERVLTFCPRCGTNVFSTTAGEGPKVYSIRTGTIRQVAELVPVAQQWTRSEQPWIDRVPSLPKFERQYVPSTKATDQIP